MWCVAWRSLRGRAAATLLVAAVAVCASLVAPGVAEEERLCPDETTVSADSCTVFAVTQWDSVLVGNNEDYPYAESFYWVDSGEGTDRDVLYFGLDDLRPRGGINQQGLCFDATGLPDALLNRHWDRPSLEVHFPILAMQYCDTVEEVIELSQQYDWGRHMYYQVLFADATGDAVVISPGHDGELAFKRKREGNSYLVATNFNLSNRAHGAYPCERYERSVVMLERTKTGTGLTPELCRDVLHSVSQREATSFTLYSNVIDPSNGLVYLYYMRQYDEVAILNVADELAKGDAVHGIRDLFSEQTVLRGESRIPLGEDEGKPRGVTVIVVLVGVVCLVGVFCIEMCCRCVVGNECPVACQLCFDQRRLRRWALMPPSISWAWE